MIEDEEDVDTYFYTSSLTRREGLYLATTLEPFSEESCVGDWLYIGSYLSTLQFQQGWSDEEFKRIRRKAPSYFLHTRVLWKHSKQIKEVGRGPTI